MKTYGEILKEIEKAKKTITGAKKAEEKEKRAYLRYEVAHGESEEARAQALQALREAEAETAKEYERETRAKIIIEILKANAGRVLYADNIGKICEIWNSYAGKPYGEKTRDKIRKEIETATGLRVWFKASPYAEIEINTAERGTLFFDYGATLSAWNKDGEKLLTAENKINRVSADGFKLCYIGEYIEDPKKHADKIIKLHQKARQALKAFEDIASEYNQATRGKVERINPREGVKNWII